jgi:hypothetical protein
LTNTLETTSKRRIGVRKAHHVLAVVTLCILSSCFLVAQNTPTNALMPMSFFITSAGPGNGGDLGGLAGADAQCQKLATAVGAGNKTWHAYLSTQASGDKPAVNARDRIGNGPWYNARGIRVADDVGELHGDTLAQARAGNNLNMATALTEKGERVPGVFDKPNLHDILTGSQTDGRAFADSEDHTCNNWTSHSIGHAQVGHHDRTGGGPGIHGSGNSSWNSSHPSRGCSQESFTPNGGAALFYCFAIN